MLQTWRPAASHLAPSPTRACAASDAGDAAVPNAQTRGTTHSQRLTAAAGIGACVYEENCKMLTTK